MPVDAISTYSNTVDLFNRSSGDAGKAEKSSQPGAKGNSEEEQKKIRELAKTDQQVRAHEAAHVAAGGQYVKGGATFSYQKGPDGKMYAVGGEVSIDTSPVKGDPKATIAKMQAIKRAALAPAEPSGQDRSVASAATQGETAARQEIAQKTQQAQGMGTTGESDKNDSSKKYSYNEKGAAKPKEIQTSLLNLLA